MSHRKYKKLSVLKTTTIDMLSKNSIYTYDKL